MISFIIIGKNEGYKIWEAISSIQICISTLKLLNTEIIYVDSHSDDDSLENALKFKNVKILSLKGDVNAAIARNEGARISKNSILFFIDGDMQISLDFLPLVLTADSGLTYPFISGDFVSIGDDANGEPKEVLYHNLKEDTYQSTTGGIFLIEKNLWVEVGGMKPKMRRSQDIDLGLRMTEMGVPLLRKKEIIAKHFTVFYHSSDRIWKDLFRGNQIYQKSVIYRDHIGHRFILPYLKREVSIMLFIASIVGFIFMNKPIVLLVYPIVIIVKTLFKGKVKSLGEFVKYIIFYFCLDLMVLGGVFFFWPSNNKKFSITKIQ